jgi:TonB family protein
MTNTTSPVESLGAPSAAASFYRWEVPGKPIAVHISLDLVDRLEREAIETFKAVTKRGSEIGGVLVGRTVPGSKRTVYLEEYEPVECEYSRGPLYMLADADKNRLKQTLDRVKAGPKSVVGFFRSNTRSNLILDDEDLEQANEFFSDPSHVFLLVRPFSMKASLGGLFFWENGQIHSEASYLQFPFKRAELLNNFAAFIVAAPEKVEAPPPVSKEPLVMPKREERPAIPTPIPFKREEPKPSVVPLRREEPEPPPPVAKREEPKPAPPPPPPVVKREEPKPAPPPVMKREEKPAPPPVAKREEPKPAPPPPPVMRREEPKPTLVPPRREEYRREDRMSPLGLKREERAASPSVMPKDQPAPPVAKKEERPAPAAPVTAKREERPLVVKEEKPPVALRKEEKPEVTPAPPKRVEPVWKQEKPAAVKVVEPARPAVPVKKEEPAAEPAEVTVTESRLGLIVRLKWVILAVLLIVIGGAYFLFGPRGSREAATNLPPPTALGLKVERNAGQLLLSWNKDASIMATASQATLTIADGESKEDIPLDLAQLRSVGSIVYSPITNDVSFRLEVTDLKNHRSASEQARFLAGRPSPLAAQAAAAKPAPVTIESKLPGTTLPVAAPAAAPPAPATAVPAPPPPVEQAKMVAGPAVTAQPPKPESLASRLRAPEPQELPAPPTIDNTAAALSARSLPISAPSAPAPAPAQPAAQAPSQPPQPAAANPATQQGQAPAPPAPAVRTGGQAQEARLVRRFPPTYPALARQTRVSGIVRILAAIGKDGKVKRATAVSGPPLLRQAAIEAVLRWVYAPATLNGQAVDAETQVDVNFML